MKKEGWMGMMQKIIARISLERTQPKASNYQFF
jgi:hypothetical protein